MTAMNNKFWYMLLSGVIAFVLWFYVITVVSPESEDTFYDIPVSYQNFDVLEERGLMIVSDTPTVTLKLKGNRSDLNELNAANITILVNLAAIQTPGTQMLRYDYSFPANLPNNAFEVLSQSPNLLELKVENRISKPVPIRIEYLGSVPSGFIADKENPNIDVTTVEVVGPESVVSQIHHASIPVDLTNQVETVVGQFAYTLCNEAGEPVDVEMVTANVETVNLAVKIQRLKELPLKLNVVDGGGATQQTCKIHLSHESIWVSGSENKLQALDQIELGTVYLAELLEENNTLEYEIVLPEGVTNTSGVLKVTVTISFPELSSKKLQLTQSRFRAANVPEGMRVDWITEVLEIEFRGPAELIEGLSEEDILVQLDFDGEEAGTVSKVPRLTLSSAHDGVGALSVPTLTAVLVEEPTNDTNG